MKLWHKVLIGMLAGIAAGVYFGPDAAVLKPVGDIFMNLIKMIIVPLIFFALISGITSISESSRLGRIGLKASVAYLTTMTFAILIGLAFALLLRPGDGIQLQFDADKLSTLLKNAPKNPVDILMTIVPDNAIGAMAAGHMVQVVFFGIFTGIAINLMGEKGRRISDFAQVMAQLFFKMIGLIIQLAPYAVFAIMAAVIGKSGLAILISLAKLVVTTLFACGLQYIVFGVLIAVFARLSPYPFYRKSIEYQTLAFSTASSKATLPTTMEVVHQRMGVSRASTSFILPLGASINMDGTAIYLGICAVFFAQATGHVLMTHDYVMIMLTATLASIGAAGIPSGSMALLPMVLLSANLPVDGIPLIFAIDPILDRFRTTINITGDAAITLILDKSEGTLDTGQYQAL